MVHKFSTCLPPTQRQSLIPSPWDGLNLVTHAYWISKGRIDGITLSRYAYKRTSSGTLTHCLIADKWGWSSALPLPSCQLSSGRRVPTHTEGIRSAPLWPPHCHHQRGKQSVNEPQAPPPITSFSLIDAGEHGGSGVFPLSLGLGWVFPHPFSMNRPLFPQSVGKRKQDFLGAFYVCAWW